jgi:hypothetical protein
MTIQVTPNLEATLHLSSGHGVPASKNLAKQKKPAARSEVNEHHAAIDNFYFSKNDHSPMELDHMEATDYQSLDHHMSSDYNHAFVTFEAPPPPSARKKTAEKVKHGNKSTKNKRKTIASSNYNGKDMAYTQSVLALAKGLKKPLAFSLGCN